MKLLSVIEAERILLKTPQKARISECPVVKSLGKILAEDICADRDQPSADRSSMDGIAIVFSAWQKGCRDFRVAGVQKAGIAQKTLKNSTDCFEIMTGALIPKGCDCVIPIEAVRILQNRALINSITEPRRLQFIRKQGSEYKKGALLITKGATINPTHISVAASVGKSKLKVLSPRIAVIGTGDELVELNRQPKIFQSRRSNAYALEAIFLRNGFADVKKFHLPDNAAVLERNLKKILNTHDVLVLSGGVSMGKFDFIPQVLNKLGVKTIFHKVAQKPGKPLLFARRGRDAKVVFGLPGNPVSTMVCAVRYVVPYLQNQPNVATVALATAVPQNPALTLFLPVSLKNGSGRPIDFAGSGDYGALTDSDGFVEIPSGTGTWKKGREAKFFAW